MAQPAEQIFAVGLPEGMQAPETEGAIAAAGELIRTAWVEFASGHSQSGEYLRLLMSPDALVYPYQGDVMAIAVVNPSRQADWLEEGRAGFHLPEHWGRGTGQWKTTKEGRRYAVVPFRHRTPIRDAGGYTPGRQRQVMPSEIYSMARKLEDGERLGGFGDLYKQSKSYTYYRQIFGANSPAARLGHGYTWASSRYEGLTRRTRETKGGGRHTEYMTWRVITPESTGWYIPPTPAYHYSQRALEQAGPAIQALLDAAAAADLATAVLNATQALN